MECDKRSNTIQFTKESNGFDPCDTGSTSCPFIASNVPCKRVRYLLVLETSQLLWGFSKNTGLREKHKCTAKARNGRCQGGDEEIKDDGGRLPEFNKLKNKGNMTAQLN